MIEEATKSVDRRVVDLTTLVRQCNIWRMKGDRIVFTNGCFDLLHRGHVTYLQEAAALGDRLVIGLNSAASVSRLKGPHRPINDELTRTHLLAALVEQRRATVVAHRRQVSQRRL